MPSRLNNTPVDVTGASVSVLHPGEDSYSEDAESYGVDNPDGRWIVGIGVDDADAVLIGTRDQLLQLARDIAHKLGG